MYDCQSKHTREAEPAQPVPPSDPRYQGGKEIPEERCEEHVPCMLPLKQGVISEVGSVDGAGAKVRFEEHPSNMGPEQSSLGVVWIKVCICMSMVGTMRASPPEARTLHSTRSSE